jgi:ketosteroid isomerase-like protein
MGSGDNADLVRRGYAAFSTGDMATLSELFASDAVWHVPGGFHCVPPK